MMFNGSSCLDLLLLINKKEIITIINNSNTDVIKYVIIDIIAIIIFTVNINIKKIKI